MDSDDIQSVGLSSPWPASLQASSTSVSVSSSAVGFAHTGQLSPISNGVDVPCGAVDASAGLASPSQSPPVTTVGHSAPSSSCPQSWTMAYPGSDGSAALARGPASHGDGHHDGHWERPADDVLAVPKLEPLDDDNFCMDSLKPAPPTPVPTLPTHGQTGPEQPKPKRPRGRPRKHPLTPVVSTNKITKGRSKTGCLTCRKRKKKCDEAKPRCKTSR